MRVVIVGGGPAGLCCGLLLKQARPSAEITILERDRPDETYGWGITLPRRLLVQLEGADRAVADAIARRSVAWDTIHLFHAGCRVDIAGTPLLGISRLTLLHVLHQRCRDAGVSLRFGTDVGSAGLPVCDLLVAADGANSGIRRRFPCEFGTSTRQGRNRYTWLGTPHVFAGLTLAFAQRPEGLFIAHAYPFSGDASTFIVECGEETWHNAALGRRSSEDACAYLAAVFAEPLGGHPLLFRQSVRWTSFVHVKNEHWRHEHIVLLGDAAHAIHFSVGSGTMLAIEDALELSAHLGGHANPADGLAEFEHTRKAAIEVFQGLEHLSVDRLERMHELMSREPLELAYILLSRPAASPR